MLGARPSRAKSSAAPGSRPGGHNSAQSKDNFPLSDIFDEVEEDVRREHYEALWKQYGHYALAFLVVLIVGVAIWQWYHGYDRTQRRMQTSDDFPSRRCTRAGRQLCRRRGGLRQIGARGARRLPH